MDGLSKAVFYIGNEVPLVPTYLSCCTVQINPSSLKHNISSSATSSSGVKSLIDFVKGMLPSSDAQETQSSVSITDVKETLSMSLYFDMVSTAEPGKESDDYATGKGDNSGAKSFKALKRAAANGWPIIFLWGKMKFEGYIDGFNCEYTYFSRSGNVRRAKVDLSIITSKRSSKNIADSIITSIVVETGLPELSSLRKEDQQADLLRN